MLGAGPGTSITISATGPQAAEAVEALAALVSGTVHGRGVSGDDALTPPAPGAAPRA